MSKSFVSRCAASLRIAAVFLLFWLPEISPLLAQTAFGELEGRPAPVSRRQCLGGANAGTLCNQNTDCPGSACQDRNIFNVSVSVRFNATPAQLQTIQNQFTAGSQILFDATDGQAQFGQVTILNNSTGTRGHFWINPGFGCATATGSWGTYTGGNVDIGFQSLAGANGDECVAHEFIHLAFDARDEYEARAPGCGGVSGAAQCPDASQGPNSAGQGACLMECCARVGNELCWGQAAGDNLAAGNHDATNITEQSRCRSNRSCWAQIGWSWPNTMLVPAGAPNPGSNGLVHQPLAFVQPPNNARLVLVLDRSGSMGSETPSRLERLQTAALDVIDLAEDGVELGIVSFATTGSDDQPVTPLVPVRTPWSDAVDNLSTGGATNIGDGLQRARDMIMAAGGVTANTGVILMTDGRNNRPLGSAAADLQAKIDLLLMENIPVWVTCTGDDLGLDSQCAEIAAGTGGSYVDSADGSFLPERFVSFYEQLTGKTLAESVERSARRIEEPVEVLMESGVREATFTLQWDDPRTEADFIAVAPDGREFKSEPMPLGRVVRLQSPMRGLWKLRVEDMGVAPEERFVLNSYFDNPRIVAPAAARHKVVAPGQPIEVCSKPLQTVAMVGLEISGRVLRPDGKSFPFALVDDGGQTAKGQSSKSGDEFPNDGTYCNRFTETDVRGAYLFELNVVGTRPRAAELNEPGFEWTSVELEPFERFIRLSATVDDEAFAGDHYRCYDVRQLEGNWEPVDVALQDQFGSTRTSVLQPLTLCNPVNKNGEGIVDPGGHLQCYATEDLDVEQRLRPRHVEVTHQFGVQRLKLTKPESLCLPTLKNRERSDLAFDAFRCYRAESEQRVQEQVLMLEDQFGKARSLLLEVQSMCTPVRVGDRRVRHERRHLTCYRIKDLRSADEFLGKQVKTSNSLFEALLQVRNERTLCLPSSKTVLKP